MMYFLLRFVIIIVFVLILLAFLKLFHVEFSKKKKIAISFICIVCIAAIFYFPLEGAFIRFDTLEQAFSYSSFGNRILNVYEAENSTFIVSGKDKNQLTYYNVTKYDNKYGMLNYDTELSTYKTNLIKSNEENISVSATSLYNKNTNESMLCVILLSKNTGEPIIVQSSDHEEIKYYSDDGDKKVFNKKYYLIFESRIPDDVYIYLNGQKVNFEK